MVADDALVLLCGCGQLSQNASPENIIIVDNLEVNFTLVNIGLESENNLVGLTCDMNSSFWLSFK